MSIVALALLILGGAAIAAILACALGVGVAYVAATGLDIIFGA